MRNFLSMLAGVLVLVLLSGCRRDEEVSLRSSGFDAFIPQYNRYISKWIGQQREQTLKNLREVEAQMMKTVGEDRDALERRLITLKREEEKWDFRLGLGDFFRFGQADEVPADLVWENGMDQEEIGDPRAKKGGTFRTFMQGFPPTLRPFGDNSNNSFRGSIYDTIEMPLVALHPKSMEMIPGLAKEWAVSKDGRTVYFRIDEEATYSDGIPVKARDFIYGSYVRISDDVVNSYTKQFYKENLAQIVVFGDRLLSISLPEAQIYAPSLLGSLSPSPPHFYKDYGPDYAERYQWKFPPTTGAYEVREEAVIKGVSITQTRVKNWWAKDRKYYKHRFNTDRIMHMVVRDESKAFELFRAGEIDVFTLTRPELWYEKAEIDPVFKGYIERFTFYNQYPALPRGLYMNVSKPLLNEKDVRIGIQHAMNWQKVIELLFRGDYKRLDAFNQGYLLFSDPTIKARLFSISSAREAFGKAGFIESGRDGILKRSNGERLSISVTYPALPLLDRMFAILREDAKSCGLDLRLDGLEATVDYKKTMQKQHEIAFGAWLISPPTPDFYQFMHSSNARDERGNLKAQTNNLWVWAREDTDILCEKVRNARTEEEMRESAVKLQNIIHDEAIFVPSYTQDFVRMGSWRWVRWPDTEETRFCPPVTYDPLDVFVHWIDEDMLDETMDARRNGKAFAEVNRIFDDYREPADEAGQDPVAEPVDKTSQEPDPEKEVEK